MQKKIFSTYFETDHDRLDLLFRHFQAHKKSDFPRAKSYFRNFLRGLKRHIAWELERIHDKVHAQNPASDAEEGALLEILGQHNRKEESFLYPAIDELVTEQDASDLFVAMEEIPEEKYMACCGPHAH